jgi:hypothetical protein
MKLPRAPGCAPSHRAARRSLAACAQPALAATPWRSFDQPAPVELMVAPHPSRAVLVKAGEQEVDTVVGAQQLESRKSREDCARCRWRLEGPADGQGPQAAREPCEPIGAPPDTILG